MKKIKLDYNKNKKYIFFAVITGWIQVYLTYKGIRLSGELLNIFTKQSDGDLKIILFKMISYLLLGFIFSIISTKLSQTFSTKMTLELRLKYLKSFFNAPFKFFKEKDISNHLSIIDSDMDYLRINYLNNIPLAITEIGQAIIYIIGLVTIHPLIMLTAIIVSIFPTIAGRLFVIPLSFFQLKRSKTNAIYLRRLKEILEGFSIIKQSENEESFLDDFKDKCEDRLNTARSINVFSRIMNETLILLNIFSYIAIIFVGSYLVSRSEIKLGALISSMTIVSIATNCIAQSFRYFMELMSTRKLKDKILNSMNLGECNMKKQKLPMAQITLKDLSFSYGDVNIFKNLNLNIKKNNTYALIGKSGSGKSTIAKILIGQLDNYTGKYQFKNGDRRDFNEKEILSLIYHMPQNPMIFDDSFENNILMYSKFNEEKFKKVIEDAALADVYYRLKGKNIDSLSLSGGEKNRISLARALYKGVDVIIFDEPTAGLDPLNKKRIEDLIFSLKDVTKIVITHNQDQQYLEKFDEVIRLEDYKE
ncbi:MAG: ABC transporter ATP-binding protein [Tissierellia bacterium]|nr:ABC transporter ATP-binding protein [Tissierellia bacterium]